MRLDGCCCPLLAAALDLATSSTHRHHVLDTLAKQRIPVEKKAPLSLASLQYRDLRIQPAIMSSPLLDLPSELVAAIFARLSRDDLCELNLTSKACRTLAAPLIWKHVDLIDCRAHTSPTTGHRTVTYGAGTATHSGRSIPLGASPGGDEHDDTPLIKKLWILAT